MKSRLDTRLVVNSGSFDVEWYEAQTGRKFDAISDAVRDYLTVGRAQGYSPHPLFEPSTANPKRWRTVEVDPLVSELKGARVRGGRPHLLLDLAGNDKRGRSRWLQWVSKVGDDDEVPLRSGEPITWSEFRAAALKTVRRQRREERLAGDVKARRAAPDYVRDKPAEVETAADEKPTVTVVMSTSNDAKRLRGAVENVQRQAFRDWELIIVDNGSDDDTALVLRGFAARDLRVRPMSINHVAVPAALNVALGAARGRYVAFLDPATTWVPDFLRTAVSKADSDGLGWAHAGLRTREGKIDQYVAFAGSREHLLVTDYIDLTVAVVGRTMLERLGGFDESLSRGFGYDLALRMSAAEPPTLIPLTGATKQLDIDAGGHEDEPTAWQSVVRMRHVLADEPARAANETSGRTSIVVPVRTLAETAIRLINQLADAEGDVEVLVVLCGPNRWTGRTVRLASINRPNVRLITWPVALDFASAVDRGAAAATGEFLVAWGTNCRPGEGWLEPLREALTDDTIALAQPLHLHVDGRIASAGGVFVGGDVMPTPLLDGLPQEDAAALSVDELPAALGNVVALRSGQFRAAGGFDPLFGNSFGEVDLSLRLRDEKMGRSVVVTRSTVTAADPSRFGFPPDPSASLRVLRRRHQTPHGSAELWGRVGFQVLGRRVEELPSAEGVKAELGALPVVRPYVHERPDRLRWAIDVAAPAGIAGGQLDEWHFARSLAAALERLGQQVHVDRREARDSEHRDLDDITLVLRGLDAVQPRPGARSMLWVISHPELVTGPEAAAFDRVFAASESWASTSSKRWDLRVEPLLQCTDPSLFNTDRGEPDTGEEFVFVGDSRGVLRFAVSAALDADLPLAVYGRGWKDLLPDAAVRDDWVSITELSRLYAASGVVLNDHWDDMRHDGFVSHRVFDVLAAGGRLVSDNVPGLDRLFGDAVPVFQSHLDLKRMFDGDWRAGFPDLEQRRRLSEQVRELHSFDARARTLLDAALALKRDDEREIPAP